MTEQASTRIRLVERFANKYEIDADKILPILKATAFKVSEGQVSNEQMAALLIVANEYGLNPFTREIFAFEDSRKGVVPVVSVDGWARIINEQKMLDGIEFVDGPEVDGQPAWIECVLHRKDRSHPTRVRERMSECKRATGPWKSHPARMLRHKALIQCARVAFGFSGIVDEDEAARIIEAGVTVTPTPERSATARLGAALGVQTDTVVETVTVATDTSNAAAQANEPLRSQSKDSPAQETVAGSPAPAAPVYASPEKRDAFITSMRQCIAVENLDLVMDDVRFEQWTGPDLATLEDTYYKRRNELDQ